ncbi:MAG: hypothetical protein ACREXY_16695, partial [Gammaproteobacteria bacterium]
MTIIVTDGRKPLPAATVWILADKPEQAFDESVLPRLVRRYGQDADYVVDNHTPHPNLLVLYTDERGETNYEVEEDSASRMETAQIQIAAFKRGFQPRVTYFRGKVKG